MSFRDTIKQLAPPWLLGDTGTRLLNTFGQMFDNMMLTLKTGLKARFPTYAPDDALGYLGNDKNLEQGPAEPNDNFRTRLRKSIDSNRNRGGARTLLTQLAAYFDGTATPPLRLVIRNGTWHEFNWGTGLTAKHIVGTNWDWDGNLRKHWGFIIIDGATLGLAPWTRGSGAKYGDGHVRGSTATKAQVQTIQRIVQRWKPGRVYVARIIVCFNTGMFLRTDTKPPNPNGNYGDRANWDQNATYWLGGGEEP